MQALLLYTHTHTHTNTSKRQISLSVVSLRFSTLAYVCRNCQHYTARSNWQSVTSLGIQLGIKVTDDTWRNLTPSDVTWALMFVLIK